jgi:hypothetical protein
LKPEVYVPPAAMPVAVAILLAVLVSSVVMSLVSPRAQTPRHPALHLIAASLSAVAIVWIPAVFLQVWSGAGPLWTLMQLHPVNESLVENLLIWAPVALLGASVVLARASGQRRRGLLPWVLVTVPAVLLVLYVVTVMGLVVSPS